VADQHARENPQASRPAEGGRIEEPLSAVRKLLSISCDPAPPLQEALIFCYFVRNPLGFTLFGRDGANKPGKEPDMADQSLDMRRIAREQEDRIAAATAVGLNAVKPMIQFQASMVRLWADNIETFARNYERGLETFSSAAEEQAKRAA
jgi:hypothetical protein